MNLSRTQAQDLIKSPKNAETIEKGRCYESTLRIYTESKEKEYICRERAWSEFTSRIEEKFNPKRYKKILNYFKYPLPVVNVAKGAIKDIYKIFDSMNSYFHTEFITKTGQEQVQATLNAVNVHGWIVKNAKEVLLNKPNSIILVDRDEKGEPYLILIESDRLIDTVIKEDATCEYIVFIHSITQDQNGKYTKFIGVYDDEFYRIFRIQDDGEPVFINEFAHGVGYCPGRMMMGYAKSNDDNYNRLVPLTDVTPHLQEYQEFEAYGYYVKHYASFPVIEKAAEKCNVLGCVDGVVYEDYVDNMDGQAKQRYHACGICSSSPDIGPGSIIKVTPKEDKDDVDSSGMFKFINPEVDILKFGQEDLDKLESRISLKVVGENEMIRQQAINKDQVKGTFEQKKNILIYWKEQLDAAYKWTVETIALTKNPSIQLIVHGNFGTEFYLLNESDLQSLYDSAKKIGMPTAEVDMIWNQLIETKYRGNPEKMQRMRILAMIDPLPHETNEIAVERFKMNIIDGEDLAIKTKMINFVNRFEAENGSIVQFGKDIPLSQKIEAIKATFKTYINAQPKNDNPEPPGTGD